jgi:Lantibiotic dehydratase, N terminus
VRSTRGFDKVIALAAVRVAALPGSTADTLAFTRAEALVTTVLDLEDRLHGEGRRLADALYDVVGSPAVSRHDRRRLVDVRRALFRSRELTPAQWDPALAGAVPGDIAARIDTWLAVRRRAARARVRLDACLAAELVEKAQALRETALAVPFTRAMAMASTALHEEVQRWAAAPDRRPKPQKLSHLAVYVARAAAKTSPFSFFATSYLGRWVEDGPALRIAGSGAPRAVLEVDADYLDRVARLLAGRAELAAEVQLRVNPSAVQIGSRVQFLGRPPNEVIITVAGTAAVQEAVRILAADPGTSRVDAARMLADAAGADLAAARRYLDRLIDVGLVEVHLPVPDASADWLGSCARWLRCRGQGPATLGGVAAALDSAAAAVRRDVPVEQVGEHRARCERVRTSLAAVAAELGGPADAGRSPVLFESAVGPGPATLGARWWRPVLADLDVLRPWLGMFDVHLPKRLAVSCLQAERFGPGSAVPLLVLYRAVLAEIAVPAAGASAGPTPAGRAVRDAFGASDPSRSQDAMLTASAAPLFRELAELRARARAGLAGAPDAGGVVRIDPGVLARQVRAWPRWLEPPASLAFYLQLCTPEDGAGVVLNAAHGGHGRSTARLRHLLGRAGREHGGPDSDPLASAPLVVELAGRHGSTLNVRSPTTPDEIAYPFVTGAGVAGAGPRLGELVAVHQPDDGVVHLRHSGHGGRILPAHLGLMSAEYLPPAARFVTQVFGTDWCYHPGALTFVPFDALTEQRPVLAYPRLAVGHVTIRRAGWLMAAAEVPRRGPREPDADFLLRLNRWSRDHGIPRRCFVRTWQRAADAAEEAVLARARTRLGKPLPLDLANWFLLPALARLVAGASMVMFEEQLPTADHGVRLGPDRFAAEVVLEVPAGVADE